MANSNKYEMELYTGSLIKKMLVFAFPLMVTGILQLLYNAADLIVVGRFAGSEALAAVGATGSLTGLMVNFFMGISVGASVCVSRAYGAGDLKELSKAVHTSITVSLIAGIFLAILGNIACRPLLRLMGTPDDVIDGASLYMHILFSGMPANMVYNFGAAILRAVGDTKRPLYFLTIAGICNVLLNLFCVIVLNMSVEGVAIATVASQVISMILVIRCLCVSGGSVRLDFKRLRIHKEPMLEILKMGLPAGLQSSLFAISNVLIQSSVNSFGSIVMAGNAAAGNLEGFVYTGMNAIYQADITFASQNRGAKQYGRMRKVLWISMMLVSIIGIVMGMTFYLCAEPLVSLYNT
ncbi:MAG: MATE family efflux transporter, partial [Clostridia bacterium]|nr:MATE family efflux transporter [Clostridia bacterium]